MLTVNWLTKIEIEQAAAESDLAALKCCETHWTQIRDAGLEAYDDAERNDLVGCGEEFCACCLRSEDCHKCPLYVTKLHIFRFKISGGIPGCCGGRWSKFANSILTEKNFYEKANSMVEFIRTVRIKYENKLKQGKQ